MQDNRALVAIEHEVRALEPDLSRMLAGFMPVEKLTQSFLVACRNAKVAECDRASLTNSIFTAAALGLPVDGTTGQAFVLPFKGKAQLVVGYKGFNTLGARGGWTITGEVWRAGDEFDYELGSRAFVHHKPKMSGKRGQILGAWALADHVGMRPVVSVLGLEELLAVKASSPAVRFKAQTPWTDTAIGEPAMMSKTAKRRLARSLPNEGGMMTYHKAARVDEAAEEQGRHAWIDSSSGAVVVEAEPLEPPAQPTPEALTRPLVDAPIAEYVERWEELLRDPEADGRDLARMWNAQKAARNAMAWPEADRKAFGDRVQARVRELLAGGQ